MRPFTTPMQSNAAKSRLKVNWTRTPLVNSGCVGYTQAVGFGSAVGATGAVVVPPNVVDARVVVGVDEVEDPKVEDVLELAPLEEDVDVVAPDVDVVPPGVVVVLVFGRVVEASVVDEVVLVLVLGVVPLEEDVVLSVVVPVVVVVVDGTVEAVVTVVEVLSVEFA